MAPAEDQDVVQALSSNGADPALRERVGLRCPNRCLHDAEALGPGDLVEGPGDLASGSRKRRCVSSSSCLIERFWACGVIQAESVGSWCRPPGHAWWRARRSNLWAASS